MKWLQTEVEATHRRQFAIVSAVYNVAPYLQDFINSIDSQGFSADQLEVILVDDGSTDGSLNQLREWENRRPDMVTVIRQPNAGQAGARNYGLEQATAEWVTFLDPDDMMGDGYLEAVKNQIDSHPDIPMLATNRSYLEESTGVLRDGHPLRYMFANGDKAVRLDHFPQYFWQSAATGFFLLDEIRRLELAFDTRVRPNFEDGHFCVRYLLETGQSMMFASSARYIYRRRSNNTSTLQMSSHQPEKYSNVPRFGYLDILERAKRLLGFVPEWLQNLIIYELSWYFTVEDQITGSRTAAQGEVGVQFTSLLAQIRCYLDTQVIESFRLRALSREIRDILLHAFSGRPWHSGYVKLDRYDASRRQVRLIYRYVGEAPVERVLLRGVENSEIVSKIRDLQYFGKVLMRERIIWASAKGTLRIQLNGVSMPLVRADLGSYPTYLRPSAVEEMFEVRRGTGERTRSKIRRGVPRGTSRIMRRAKRRRYVRRFASAWVLMDRIHQAGDNAERLFEYTREHRPDLNTWFVIEQGTADWERLRSSPWAQRVVAHGSIEWKILMMHCSVLISSHVEDAVIDPQAMRSLRPSNWKFVFLQHGVTKDDMSRWLNRKSKINLMITATQEEHASIAGDGAYGLTAKEVKLTGFPRFDRLLSLGESTPPSCRDLILVAPTWRAWLNAPLRPGTQRRELVDDFESSEYVRQWQDLLGNGRLRSIARSNDLRIGFLPHPNMADALPRMRVPVDIERLTYDDYDIQNLLARTRLLVTDYSSLAFDAAYLNRPVVYFQFDAERMFFGDHSYRPGYFDYKRDGFGPVASEFEQVVDQIVETIDDEESRTTYQHRIVRAFRFRDGNCCDRVVNEIEAL